LKKADATHATGDDNKDQFKAKYPETGIVTLDGITYVARDVKPQRTIEQGPDVTLNMQEQVAVIGHGGGTASGNKILMVLDGASTVGVIEDEQYCSEVWPTDKWIKTGGQGKPNLVHCTKAGLLQVSQVTNGRRAHFKLEVRIIPGFGCNIMPECFFLQKCFDVNKSGAKRQVEVVTPDAPRPCSEEMRSSTTARGCSTLRWS